MSALGLSLTREHGLSLTAESAYRKPKSDLKHCSYCEIKPLNYANSESFGFFLTAEAAAGSDLLPPTPPALAVALPILVLAVAVPLVRTLQQRQRRTLS